MEDAFLVWLSESNVQVHVVDYHQGVWLRNIPTFGFARYCRILQSFSMIEEKSLLMRCTSMESVKAFCTDFYLVFKMSHIAE